MSSRNLDRGIQLYELGKFKEACKYLNDSIAEDPNNSNAKLYLAFCFFNLKKYDASLGMADELLKTTPNSSEVFFLKAQNYYHKDNKKEALTLIDTALEIDPNNANYFGLKGAILLSKKKYDEALAYVNEGLQINPKNNTCLNLRAQILTKLDRIEEADETVEFILNDNPEDCYSHANVGWVALENKNTEKSLHHFKQALQFDPNFEYARQGMSTALKSKNFIYRWYLNYAFWISNQSSKKQWGFIIGIYIAYRLSVKLLEGIGLSYIAIPLIIAYLLFALGGWIMEPLSNTILSFDKYGKFLLSKSEKISGLLFGLLFVLGIGSIALFYSLNVSYYFILSITFLCCLIPAPRALLQHTKKAKIFGLSYGALILLTGIIGPFIITDMSTISIAVIIMTMAFTWIGNIFN